MSVCLEVSAMTGTELLNYYLETKDSEALTSLHTRYNRLMEAATMKLNNDVVLEDCVNDTWLRLMQTEQPETPIRNPTHFLLAMLRNIVMNHHKHENVRAADSIESLARDPGFDVPSTAETPVEVMEHEEREGYKQRYRQQRQRLLSESLHLLSASERQALDLYYGQDKTRREVASAMGINEADARALIDQAAEIIDIYLKRE